MNINSIINHVTSSMQNPYIAATTAVVSNVVFCEIAVCVAAIAGRTFEKLSEGIGAVACLTTFGISVAGMNIALHKLLKLPFNPWVTAGIGIATNISYIAFKLARD